MSQFEELLKSLQATADEQENGAAPGADDETIAAAAADAGVAADGNPEGEVDDDTEGKPAMTKSLQATGEDGEPIEMVDATEMLKSLQAGQAEQAEVLAKALTTMTTALQKQGETIKSLRAEVKALAGQGRGRKAVVVAGEKTLPTATMTKSQQASEGVKPQEILAKCLSAQKAGALTGLDVARAETAINHGVAIPADILSRIQ